MLAIESPLERIVASAVLGGFTGAIAVQAMIFLGSIFISIAGFLKERVFSRKYFVVWVKSILGLVACGLVVWLGFYIVAQIEFPVDKVDFKIFWVVTFLIVLGFLLHVGRKLKIMKEIVETSEFDEIHQVATPDAGIDDYVRKNLELLKTLQDGSKD